MARSFKLNVINGQVPEMAPAFPERSIGLTGTGTGDGGGGGGTGAGTGAGAGAGAGAGGAGAGGAGAGDGDGVDAALCVAVTDVPATATDKVRAAPEFTETTTRSVASPRPLSGETVAHVTSLFAAHEQAECARTAIPISPPWGGTVFVFGVTS
jgi:hypothetical protein